MVDIKKILVILFLILIVAGNIYSIATGWMKEDFKEIISGLYGISILGLLLTFWIEMSDAYVKHHQHRGLLIGLCSLLLVLAIGLLIGMFMVDYSWFMRILEILMILLLTYSLIKVIKRR